MTVLMRVLSLGGLGLLVLAGCKPDLTPQRWGGCDTMGGDHCGAVVMRGNDRLDLTCDTGPKPPPRPSDPLPLPLSCRCLENGVEKKTVKIEERIPAEQTRAVQMARTACGW